MIETKTAETIHREVSEMVSDEVSLIDALVEYADRHDMEIETLGMIVKRSIIMRQMVKNEATKLNMIKADEQDRSIFDEICV